MSIMRCRSLSGWAKGLPSEVDDDHTAAAAWAGIGVGRIGFARVIGSLVWIGLRGRREQLAHPGDVMRRGRRWPTGRSGECDGSMEAARQDVNEKAADELGDGKRQRLLAIAPLGQELQPVQRLHTKIANDQIEGNVLERTPCLVDASRLRHKNSDARQHQGHSPHLIFVIIDNQD